MEPLLRQHDRQTLEIFCYASVARPDATTARLSALSEHFRDWCYEPCAESPDVSLLPALGSGVVTFGCLNSFKKVSDRALALWGRVLAANPGSRLRLIAPLGQARARVLTAFERVGVGPERVAFLAHASRPEYLALYRELDICLDPTPSGGGTTTLDSFWMGVPVVWIRRDLRAGSKPRSAR